MGFGTGFDAPPRRGAWIPAIAAADELVNFLIEDRVLVLTPAPTTPAPTTRGSILSETPPGTQGYSRALISPTVIRSVLIPEAGDVVMPGDPRRRDLFLGALRSIVSDARDLFLRVVRAWLAPTSSVQIDEEPEFGGDESDYRNGKGHWYQNVVHIGPTRCAQDLLRQLVARTRSVTTVWDGDLGTLDADGFLHLSVKVVDPGTGLITRHLILAGGSEYGTHHAVTAFLRDYLGVEWLFPGPLGEVIPPGFDTLDTRTVRRDVDPIPNRIDEPTIRARNFGAMTSGSTVPTHTLVEIDQIRQWLLCNRIRPSIERALMMGRLPTTFPTSTAAGPSYRDDFAELACRDCRYPESSVRQSIYAALLETEERVPIGHNLTRLLSPYQPSLALFMPFHGSSMTPLAASEAARSDLLRLQVGQMISVYPDLRPRTFGLMPVGGTLLDARLGVQSTQHVITVAPSNARCESTGDCGLELVEIPCPTIPGLAEEPQSLGVGVDSPGYLQAHNVEGIPNMLPLDSFAAVAPQRLGGQVVWRFLPCALRGRLEGPQWPRAGWHPCVFDLAADPGPDGLHPAQSWLVEDLAAQVYVSLLGRGMRLAGDRAISLAFEDGNAWCECDACLLSDSEGGYNNDLLLDRGQVLTSARGALDMHEPFLPTDASGATALGSIWPDMESQWRVRIAANMASPVLDNLNQDATGTTTLARRGPWWSQSLDRLALRGIVYDRGYSARRSQRVVSLVSAVATRMMGFFEALSRDGGARWANHNVISFQAYTDHAAPPLGLATTAPTRLPRALLVNIAGTRDTEEYDHPYDIAGTGAYARLRASPARFNHERWANIASRTGFYEYVLGGSFLVPRNYTTRLRSAIQTGVDLFSLKSFGGEMYPAFGLQGPMLWSLARVLWDPSGPASTPSAMLQTFCDRAFGPASRAMQDFFALGEAGANDAGGREIRYVPDATSSTGSRAVPWPDRRTDGEGGSGYFGQGFGGRQRLMSQFAGMYESVPVAGTPMLRLEAMWAALQRARDATAEGSAERRRVQLYRRTFGLTRLVATWYKPLHDAFEKLRAANPYDATNPATWTMTSLINPKTLVPQVSTGSTDPRVRFPRHPNVRLVTFSEAEAASLRDLLIGAAGVPGIRRLRFQVHRYLAMANVDERAMSATGDLGLGLFPLAAGAVLADGQRMTDPLPEGTPERHVGLYLPEVLGYQTWWNGVFASGVTTLDAIALNSPLVTSEGDISHDNTLGWVFTQIKTMARIIVRYCGICTSSGDSDEVGINDAIGRG